MQECNLDYISFSGHKFNGLKGCGALICVNEYAFNYIHPMIFGGHQQNNIRSGTLPTDLINHMCLALKQHIDRIESTQEKNISINKALEKLFALYFNKEDYIINSYDYNIPIFNISFKGCSSGYIMQELDKQGFMVSTGSACHTGDLSPSYVLTAMKCPEEYINNTIRISFDSWDESTRLFNLTNLVSTIYMIIRE
jgi:cysteine desulfurase